MHQCFRFGYPNEGHKFKADTGASAGVDAKRDMKSSAQQYCVCCAGARCAQWVRRESVVCAQGVRGVCAGLALDLQCVCARGVRGVCAGCAQGVRRVCAGCALVCAGCAQGVRRVCAVLCAGVRRRCGKECAGCVHGVGLSRAEVSRSTGA